MSGVGGGSANPVMVYLLEGLALEARAQGNDRLANNYLRALESVRRYPLPLKTGEEATQLDGVGPFIAKKIDALLVRFQKQADKVKTKEKEKRERELRKQQRKAMTKTSVPKARESVAHSENDSNKENEPNDTGTGKKRKVGYTPRHRSGPYALLLGLRRADLEGIDALGKEDLKIRATPFFDTLEKAGEGNGLEAAWKSAMPTLIKKELVIKHGSGAKITFSLSAEGRELAQRLEEGAIVAPLQDITNMRGTNHQRVENIANVNTLERSGKAQQKEAASKRVTVSTVRVEGVRASKNSALKSKRQDEAETEIATATPPRPPGKLKRALSEMEDVQYYSSQEKTQETQREPVLSRHPATTSHKSNSTNKFASFSRSQASVTAINSAEWIGKDRFEVLMLLDNREVARKQDRSLLHEKMLNKGVPCEARNLPLGDVLWIARLKEAACDWPKGTEFVLDVIVERKKLDDLWASIKDGRYYEQKFRLKRCGVSQVMYLVEGAIKQNGNYRYNPHHFQLPIDTLETAMLSTQVSSGFMIHRTSSISETISYLKVLHQHIVATTDRIRIRDGDRASDRVRSQLPNKRTHIRDDDKDEHSDGDASSDEKAREFASWSDSVSKSGNLTVTDVFAMQLMQIGGMSALKAKAVTDYYPTARGLYNALRACQSQEERDSMLKDLPCGSRKLGAALAQRLGHIYGHTSSD